MKRLNEIFVLIGLSLAFGSGSVWAQGSNKTKVDFSDMHILGQTKRADGVYMFDRGQLQQGSLTKPRENYRKEILESMFD